MNWNTCWSGVIRFFKPKQDIMTGLDFKVARVRAGLLGTEVALYLGIPVGRLYRMEARASEPIADWEWDMMAKLISDPIMIRAIRAQRGKKS